MRSAVPQSACQTRRGDTARSCRKQHLPMRKGLAVGKPPQAAARVAQKCIKP
jgi:hypothetical protein